MTPQEDGKVTVEKAKDQIEIMEEEIIQPISKELLRNELTPEGCFV